MMGHGKASLDVVRALRAVLHDEVGPAAAVKVLAVLDGLWAAGVCVVPFTLDNPDDVADLRLMAARYLFDMPPTDGRDAFVHIWEMAAYKLHFEQRQVAKKSDREQSEAADAAARRRAEALRARPQFDDATLGRTG